LSETSLWELKEAAKWSSNTKEMKEAVGKLSARGAEALPSLQEIMSVTAYDDIKAACIDAIKSVNKEGRPASNEGKGQARLADLPP
jgi:hypothetical protein